MGHLPLTPPAGEAWRLRPRDGQARALVEHIAQRLWRWRIELALAYIVVAVTLAALFWAGL